MRTAGVLAAITATLLIPTVVMAGSDARLTSEERLDPVYGQGIARVDGGWIVSGRDTLGRLDDSLVETARAGGVIPPEWAAQGFNHVGDPDVFDGFLYAPLEQPDYDRGEQATARFDPTTLAFVDAVVVAQHENSFVTVGEDGIAYSMDRFGGNALLRYDIAAGWQALAPVELSRTVERVQGADIVGDVAWLSTDDDRHAIFRVDLATGRVDEVGSTGHLDGEGEGIDATALPSGTLHTLTVDAAINPVWLGHFEVTAPGGPGSGGDGDEQADDDAVDDDAVDSGWPPVLVAGAVLLVGLVVVGIVAVLRQARAATREARDGRGEE